MDSGLFVPVSPLTCYCGPLGHVLSLPHFTGQEMEDPGAGLLPAQAAPLLTAVLSAAALQVARSRARSRARRRASMLVPRTAGFCTLESRKQVPLPRLLE